MPYRLECRAYAISLHNLTYLGLLNTTPDIARLVSLFLHHLFMRNLSSLAFHMLDSRARKTPILLPDVELATWHYTST